MPVKKKSKFSVRNPIYRPPTTPRQKFEETHSTSAGRKRMASSDRKKLKQVYGENWRQKVFGDVKRYKRSTKVNRTQNEKVDKLREKEGRLNSQKGTPGMSDEALQRHIDNLEQKAGTIKAKSGVSASVYHNKRRFQRAAENASETLAQRKSKNVAKGVRARYLEKRAKKTVANPNSPFNIANRKKKAKAKLGT